MMSIIGFSFTKIMVEKHGSPDGKINISNNIGITDVSNAEVNFGGDANAGVKFGFSFSSVYEPNVGKIQLEGEVIAMEKKAMVDEVIAAWKGKKPLPQSMMSGILNTVLNKCNIEALILSKDINLPSPVPLPKVNVQTRKESKKEEKS